MAVADPRLLPRSLRGETLKKSDPSTESAVSALETLPAKFGIRNKPPNLTNNPATEPPPAVKRNQVGSVCDLHFWLECPGVTVADLPTSAACASQVGRCACFCFFVSSA